MPDKIKYQDFAKRIKEKYPQYSELDDSVLTSKILDKYPQYKDTVDFEMAKVESSAESTIDEQKFIDELSAKKESLTTPPVAANSAQQDLSDETTTELQQQFPTEEHKEAAKKFSLTYKEPKVEEAPNFMGLFDKKKEFKTANEVGVSVSFLEKVNESAKQSVRPLSYLVDVNNLTKRIEKLPEYFPELTDQVDALKKQMYDLNSTNVESFRQQLDAIEDNVRYSPLEAMAEYHRPPGSDYNDPAFSEYEDRRDKWLQYENTVKNDAASAAVKMLEEDNRRLVKAANIPKGKEVDGWLNKFYIMEKARAVGFGHGLVGDYVEGYTIFTDEIKKNQAITAVLDKAERIDNGEKLEFTEEEKLILQAIVTNAELHEQLDENVPRAYKMGRSAGHSLGFMAEYTLTGGGKTVGTSILKGAVKIGAKKYVGKFGVGMAVKLAQAGIQTTKMPMFYQEIAKNTSLGMDFNEALLQAYWTTTSETFSERIFIQNPVKGKGLNVFDDMMRRMGVNFKSNRGALGVVLNTIEETAEEKVNEIFNAPKDYKSFKDFWKAFTDREQFFVMTGSVAMMVGTMGSASILGNTVLENRHKSKIAKLEKFVPTDLRAEIDAILEAEDLSVEQQYGMIGDAISDRIDRGELGEDPATTTGNAMLYAQYRTSQIANEATNKDVPEITIKPESQKEETVKPEVEEKLAETKDEVTEKEEVIQQPVEEEFQKEKTVKEEKEKKLTEDEGYGGFTETLGLINTDVEETIGETARSGEIDGVDIVVRKGLNDKDVVIESIRTPEPERRKGKAAHALRKMIGEADRLGITLNLRAVPEEGSGISKKALKGFYESYGFKFRFMSDVGERAPAEFDAERSMRGFARKAKQASPFGFVESADELAGVIPGIEKNPAFKANKDRVEAIVDPKTGKIWFVKGQIKDEADAIRLWAHEQGVHKGMRVLFPNENELENILNKVHASVDWDKVAKETPKIVAYIENWKRGEDNKASRATLAEEYLAAISEKIITKQDLTPVEKTIWDQFVDAFVEALNKIFGNIKLSDREIADIVRASVQSIYQEGEQQAPSDKGSKIKLSIGGIKDAEKVRESAKAPSSQEKGVEQGEEGRLRVRDAEKDRMEAENGEEVEPVVSQSIADGFANILNNLIETNLIPESSGLAGLRFSITDSFLSLDQKTKFYKKAFGETAAKAIRTYMPISFDYENQLKDFLGNKIPVKSNMAFVIKNIGSFLEKEFLDLLSGGLIKTEGTKAYDPHVLLREIGYSFNYTPTGEDVLKFRMYYPKNGSIGADVICTYNDPHERAKSNYVSFIVKDDALETLPAEQLTQEKLSDSWKEYLEKNGRKNADGTYNLEGLKNHREDPFSTSVLSIQISKNGKFVKIISRYNHTIHSGSVNPDATHGGNLENIIAGLTKSLNTYFNVNIGSKEAELPDGIVKDDKGRYFNYIKEVNGVYYGEDFFIEQGGESVIIDRNSERIIDGFLLKNNGTIEPIAHRLIDKSLFPHDVQKIIFTKKDEIRIESKKEVVAFTHKDTEIDAITEMSPEYRIKILTKLYNAKISDGVISIKGVDLYDKYIHLLWRNDIFEIRGDAFFHGSQVTSLGNLQSIGGNANFRDSQITSLGNLQSIGGNAYFHGSQITSLGSLQSIGGYADFSGSQITSLGSLQSIGGYADFSGSQITSLGSLQSIGRHAYFHDSQVTSLGNLQSIGGYADFRDSQITSLGNLQSIGGNANFRDSQITSLGNLQSIGGNANFRDSQITSLGNLQSIGGYADFSGSQHLFDALKIHDSHAIKLASEIHTEVQNKIRLSIANAFGSQSSLSPVLFSLEDIKQAERAALKTKGQEDVMNWAVSLTIAEHKDFQRGFEKASTPMLRLAAEFFDLPTFDGEIRQRVNLQRVVRKMIAQQRKDLAEEGYKFSLTDRKISKKESDDKKTERRLRRSGRQAATDGQPPIGKGETSSAGARLVDAIESEPSEGFVAGEKIKVESQNADVIVYKDANGDIQSIDKSKVLAETEMLPVEGGEINLDQKASETSIDKLNDDLLNDEVYNKARLQNVELTDDETLGLSAFVKHMIPKGKNKTIGKVIDEAIALFKKKNRKGQSPAADRVNRRAYGSNYSTPNATYNDAVRNNHKEKGENLWVRNDRGRSNKGRVLMVQFSSNFLYGKQPFKRHKNDAYFDKLYRLIKGYDRTVDFWEVPLWIARVAGMEANSDVYVIRDLNEAKAFFKEAGYDRILFSALDVNEKHIVEILENVPDEKFHIGGYTNFDRIKAMPNATVFEDMRSYARANKVRDRQEYSYRHFRGTAVIPRLKMSEGCRYKCAFCSIPKQVINQPSAVIMRQVESIKDLDARLVYLDDKTFGQATNYTLLPEVYERIKEYNPDFEGFIIQTTSLDFANKKKFSAEYLKASGIKYVELGVETYNDDILTALNKRHSHAKFTNAAMQNARENDIRVIPNIIVGLVATEKMEDGKSKIIAQETEQSYINTLNFLQDNADIISHLNVYSLALYEGTELGDAVEVKTEADRNENIISKSFHENREIHEWAMDAFSDFATNQVEGRAGVKFSIAETKKAEVGKNLVPEDWQIDKDGKGNFVFYHYGDVEGNEILPNFHEKHAYTGSTGRVNKVSYYYTRKDDKEHMIRGNVHVVKVPEHKVYPFNTDPLDLYDKAKEIFNERRPGLTFSPVNQIDYMHPLIREAGFDMVVAHWGRFPFRGETTVPLKYDEEYTENMRKKGTLFSIADEFNKKEFADNVKTEVEKVKAIPEKEGGGQTFELNGQTFTGTGLVTTIESQNTTQEELSPEMVATFVEQNKDKIGSLIVKPGLYKFEGSDGVSIDLNIVIPKKYKDVAVEYGRLAGQEALFDMETFENVYTGADGKNPKKFTAEEYRIIAESLSKGELPPVFEEKETKFSIGEQIPAEVLSESKEVFDRVVKQRKSEQEGAMAAFTNLKRSQWYEDLPPIEKARAGAKFSEITERWTSRPTEPKNREKIPSAKPSKKVVVDEMKALHETIRREARAAKEGSKEMKDVKNSIVSIIQEALKERNIDQLTRTEATQLLNKIKKAIPSNIESIATEAIDFVERIYERNAIKRLIGNIEKLLKTKTITKTDRGVKKAASVSRQVKYYLDEAKAAWGIAKLLKKSHHLKKSDFINAKTAEARKVQELEYNLAAEEADNLGRNTFHEYIEGRIAKAMNDQLSDDAEVREKAIYEEVALRDMQNAYEQDMESLADIFANISRTVSEGRNKLKEEIEKDVQRRNEIKEKAREATKNEYSGKSRREIQNERFKRNKNKIRLFFIESMDSINEKLTKPVTTSFEFLLKYIEAGNYRMGEGWLYDFFFKGDNGWMENRRRRLERKEDISQKIRDKIKAIPGVKWVGWRLADWSTVTNETGVYKLDGDGVRSVMAESMSRGQAMYIYALSKMDAVAPKLYAQGWDDLALEQIKEYIGKDLVDFADWVQSEFLPDLHKDYNDRYIEIYKTALDNIPNYFPLLYDSFGGVQKNAELIIGESKFFVPSEVPKHIKSRVQNMNEVSTTADFFEVMYNYIDAMEKFYNYASFIKDINVLFIDNVIRTQLKNSDAEVLDQLIYATNRAIENDSEDTPSIERAFHSINRGTAFAKIAVRTWTAMKQYLSLPAYFEQAKEVRIKIGSNTVYIPALGTALFTAKAIYNILNPVATYLNHKFFMKHSAFYRARLEKGDFGDEEISRGFVSLHKMGASKLSFVKDKVLIKLYSSGIFFNKMVDAHTIISGGRVLYNQQFNMYKKIMPEAEAHRLAIRDFDIAYNSAQQSSEPAFLSEAQGRKGIAKSIFATFKNSQFSYFRKIMEGKTDLLNGYIRTVDKYEKKYVDSGMSAEKAKMKARAMGLKYLASHDAKQDFKKLAIYGYVLPVTWQYVMSGLPGLMTEWDDDDTDEMLRAAAIGILDGMFIIGDLAKFGYDVIVIGNTSWEYDPSQLVKTINDGIKSIGQAVHEEGSTNFDVAAEVLRQAIIIGGLDWSNIDRILEGAEGLIIDGEWTEENILELLTAPKTIIKQVSAKKDKRKGTDSDIIEGEEVLQEYIDAHEAIIENWIEEE